MPEIRDRNKRCPHCGVEVEYWKYKAEQTEYGSCNLDGDDWNADDTDTQESNYFCPECDAEIATPDEIPYIQEETDSTESTAPTITVSEPVTVLPDHDLFPNNHRLRGSANDEFGPVIECCGLKYEFGAEETEIECSTCHQTLTRGNATSPEDM